MRADFCLGGWIISPRRGCIERGGEVVHVHPKPMLVLECLADAHGEVVTRNHLHDSVWPDVIVTDDALTQCVAELRKAFGDSAKDSQIIKTIPKVGFCLLPPVEPSVKREGAQENRTRMWLIGLVAITGLIAITLFWRMTDVGETGTPVVAPRQPSVAVLPFANRSANPDDTFFVEGIHDDLLTHLSKIGGIKTISRTSVMQYRDSTKSIPEIANELGVNTILEGGVQRDGNLIHINVQLIDAENDTHIWSEIYERQLSAGSIFAVQNEISRKVSGALKTVLSPKNLKRLSTIPTESLEAYEAFLQGRHYLAKRGADSLSDAVKFFSNAVEIDPKYALAWASLGEAYLLQREGDSVFDSQLLGSAQVAIEKALSIDSELGEAYTTLAMLRWNQDDYADAEKYYLVAIELAPNFATTYHWYSILLRAQGRMKEAGEMISTAAELDPMSPVIRQNLAVFLRGEGRYQEALLELEKAILIDPGFARAYDAIATMEYQVFNRLDRAAQGFIKFIELSPNSASGHAFLGQLFLDLGEPGRASILFDQSQKLVPESFGAFWGQLLFHVYQAELDGITASTEGIFLSFHKSRWEVQFTAAQLRNQAIFVDQIANARAVYLRLYPDLFEEAGPDIGLHNYRAAIDLSLVLQKSGEALKANMLLDRCQDFIRGRPRLGWWGGYWVSDVQILALQGRKKEALAALQRAADEGWRSLWWYYLWFDPNLDSIRGEAGFQRVVDQIETDMSLQMQRIREMEKNDEISSVPGVIFK